MTGFKHKNNSGSLFKNDRRDKETSPHAKGSAVIDGIEFWVSAWTNSGNQGKYQSLKFTRKDEAPRKESAPADFDDDLPF